MHLAHLNEAQRAAVAHGQSPLLVLAGAGTGKTTVITHRIARILTDKLARPEQILAMTFTNKAAREMRARAGALAGLPDGTLEIGTFHSICGRLLRRFATRVGLQPSFVIYDADDSLQLIKRCMRERNIDTQMFPPSAIRWRIEQWKNQGKGPRAAEASPLEPASQKALEVYSDYARRCLEANAVDFGDLLLHTVTLLTHHADVLAQLRQRWTHLLVDEYQDTNPVQYQLLAHLMTPEHSLTVVGDDDQSIYRWRGADIGNILRFERDFPGASVIRLEENYRSTQTILDAANAVIARNVSRKGKTLYSTAGVGARLQLRVYQSERGEAEAVAEGIQQAVRAGEERREIAVLYRTNAQSRPLEDALRRQRIPYIIYGGVRFYDRREIKDALAYLRLVLNPSSEIDFLRVVNVPARGIGKTSLERLTYLAIERGASLYEAAHLAAQGNGNVTKRARQALGKFVGLIESLRQMNTQGEDPAAILQRLLDDSGYLAALRTEGTEQAQARLENLGELVSAVNEFVVNNTSSSLEGFLEEAALATDIDQLGLEDGQVTLMTLHAAKGLEFGTVFLPGMEEGLFPHSRSLTDKAALEEERRLCYVGMTRAKRTLHLSAARMRTVFGETRVAELSRFLGEVPRELLDLGAAAAGGDADAPEPAASRGPNEPWIQYDDEPAGRSAALAERAVAGSDFTPGTRVYHASFGEGEVLDAEGVGPRQKLVIRFPEAGKKTIVARFVERV